jgi:replicative DNA helicase
MDGGLDEEQDTLDDARAAVTDLAEKALLGGLLLRQRTRDAVREWLTPEHFRSWTHGVVYRALLDLDDAQEGDEADSDRPRAVAERAASAPAVTPQYVLSLAGACPRFDHVPQYARLVVRSALRRSVAEDAAGLARAAAQTDVDDPPRNGPWPDGPMPPGSSRLPSPMSRR